MAVSERVGVSDIAIRLVLKDAGSQTVKDARNADQKVFHMQNVGHGDRAMVTDGVYTKRPRFPPPPRASFPLLIPPMSKKSPKGNRRLCPEPLPRLPSVLEDRVVILPPLPLCLCREGREMASTLSGVTVVVPIWGNDCEDFECGAWVGSTSRSPAFISVSRSWG